MIHDLNKYKRAVVLCKEIKPLITILEKAEGFFLKKNHRKYRPIQELLYQIRESKRVLKIQYSVQSKILETKAGKNE